MPASPDVIRISSPVDLVATVPHLLGFHPTESVVVLTMHPPRRRVGMALRLDLPAPEQEPAAVQLLIDRVARQAPTELVIVILTDEPDDGAGPPRAAMVERFLAHSAVPVSDALLVRHNRVTSYVCHDRTCCPTDGQELDPMSAGATAVRAAHAMHGRAVLHDRDAVVRSVLPVAGIAAESMRQALARNVDGVLGAAAADRRRRARELLEEVTTRCSDPRAAVTHDESAALALAWHDVVLRDELLAAAGADDRRAAVRPVVAQVARSAQQPYDAPACTLLGCLAYCDGDGVVATAALERALGTDPAYSLAVLVSGLIERQVHPEQFRAVLRPARSARRRRSAAR